MRKLILRLLVVILFIYFAGSILPLFATVGGHGPASSPPPAPVPPPTTPSSPPMLDSKAPPLQPPLPRDPKGGGCSPQATQTEPPPREPLLEAVIEVEKFRNSRSEDFDNEANLKIYGLKKEANHLIGDIKKDLKEAQDGYHEHDIRVEHYQTKKREGALVDPYLLKKAQEERELFFQEVQRLKKKLEEVADWRNRKTKEVWSLRDRAKNGEYDAYRRLVHYEVSYHPASSR
jgi:hypothetical protein